MQLERAEGGRTLREVLLDIYEYGPTLQRAADRRFVPVWQDELDLAYTAPDHQLADLLLVNEVVAAQTRPLVELLARARRPGSTLRVRGNVEWLEQGASYHDAAVANTVRLAARLGEDLPQTAAQQLWSKNPSEVYFLRWCQCWMRGQPEQGLTPDWAPISETDKVVRMACRALVSASNPAELDPYSRPGGTRDQLPGPLSFVRRLACLSEASLLLRTGRFEDAELLARKAGPDGDLLAARAALERSAKGVGAVLLPDRSHARFRAYRARRLAERMDLLEFSVAAARWRAEQTGWETVAAHL